jgi:hypothetical protein
LRSGRLGTSLRAMTGSSAPLDCELCLMAGANCHGGGPWATIHGAGAECEDIASNIMERLASHRVAARLRPIDEIFDLNLVTYTGLALVLPSTVLTNVVDVLKPFADLVVDYRARRRPGLELILNGSRKWFDVGDVRLIGPRALIQHGMMKTARAHACALHYIDGGLEAVDILEVYRNRGLALVRETTEQPDTDIDIDIANIQRTLRRIESWGVEVDEIPLIIGCIDRFRDHYENERFSQLYRPIPGRHRNRLDIILDGPHDIVIGDAKTWQDNGARVVREVRSELYKLFPRITRPGNADKTKDAVKAFTGFYRDLQIIDKYTRNKA